MGMPRRLWMQASCVITFVALGATGCGSDSCDPQEQQAQCRLLQVVTDNGSSFVGPEDITIDHAQQIAYISADPRAATRRAVEAGAERLPQGAIYALDLTALPQKADQPATVRNLTKTFSRDHDFHPHGISLQIEPSSGARRLLVINHANSRQNGQWTEQHFVEQFEIADGSFSRVERTDLGDLHCVNDLAVIDSNRFLVTNSARACTGADLIVNVLLGRRTGSVVLFDGSEPKTVLRGFRFGNGITTISPPDTTNGGPLLYVADSGAGEISVFDLSAVLAGDGDPTGRTVVTDAGLVDNLEWREDGALYVATHPSPTRFALYGQCQLSGSCGESFSSSPSEVFRIDHPQAGPPAKRRPLYCDDGRELSGSSVAAAHRGVVIVGSVFESELLVCDDLK
jgi:hypothetical protein